MDNLAQRFMRVFEPPAREPIPGETFGLCSMCGAQYPYGEGCPKCGDTIAPETPLKITSIDDLKRAIKALVGYNWVDERADYNDQPEGRDAHIFTYLVALDNWVEDTEFTPDFYLEVKRGQ